MKHSPSSVSNPTGFSLVELLVSIVILSVLIGLGLGVTSRLQSRGMDVRCLSNLRQIGAMLQQFIVDNKGYLPNSYRRSTNRYWFQQISAYATQDANDAFDPRAERNLFSCPASRTSWPMENRKFHGNYGWNIGYGNSWEDLDPLAATIRVRRDGVKAHEVALIADASSGPYTAGDACHWFSYSASSLYLDFRHLTRSGVHVLFADGSVRAVPKKEANSDFFNPTRHRFP